jgi:hypothetical protein
MFWELLGIYLLLAGELSEANWALNACITFEKGAPICLDRRTRQYGKF